MGRLFNSFFHKDNILREDNEPIDRLRLEREALGFYLTGHPMDKFPGLAERYSIQDIKEGKVNDGQKIRVPGVVSSLVKRRTHKGQNMATLNIEDRTGRIAVSSLISVLE